MAGRAGGRASASRSKGHEGPVTSLGPMRAARGLTVGHGLAKDVLEICVCGANVAAV